jgi:protein gp37
MAEKTGIAWTTHTWSPWIGCTEISTAKSGGGGCDNCYARELDKRHRWGGATHWGVGVPRYRTKSWHLPVAWDKKAAAAGTPASIFPSLCDPFDNEVDPMWRHDLWKLIINTPNLSWLLVTKRIGNAATMWPALKDSIQPNLRLLITVCNQPEADRDVGRLLALPCKNGISYEPALGPVDWAPWLLPAIPFPRSHPFLQWIIVGGESTQGAGNARGFNLQWARSTIAQCKAANVPCFVKQCGSEPYDHPPSWDGKDSHSIIEVALKDRAGADPAEWPEDLRVQEFPA